MRVDTSWCFDRLKPAVPGQGVSGQLGPQPSPPPCNPLGFELPSPTLPPTSRPPWYSPNLPAQRSEWVLAFTWLAVGLTPLPYKNLAPTSLW